MKGLVAGMAVAAVLATGVPMASAGPANVDPMTIGGNGDFGPRPGALEGGYNTGGGLLQFLALGAPQECLNGTTNCDSTQSHIWFYNATCTRVSNKTIPLTRNDLLILPLHDNSTTTNRVGNFLVAGTTPDSNQTQVRVTTHAIIGESWFVDTVRGIGRVETLSARFEDLWADYHPAKVILLAPPDDGSFITGTLIFRCPTGLVLQKAGTAGGTVFGNATPSHTLGADMLDIASQMSDASTPGDSNGPDTTIATDSTLCGSCSNDAGVFARSVDANVYDDNEEFLVSVDGIPCRCLGAAVPATTNFVTEIRLKDLAADAATKATYWEMFGGFIPGITGGPGGGDGHFTVALNVVVNAGVGQKYNLYTRAHHARDRENIE